MGKAQPPKNKPAQARKEARRSSTINDRKIIVPEAVQYLDLDDINPPDTFMRSSLDDSIMETLECSIKTVGVIQPIIVRPDGDKYKIVAGFRRYTASRNNGLKTIPVIIRDLTDAQADFQTFEENSGREDLSPYDEAKQIAGIKEKHGLTNLDLSNKLHRSEAFISQRLKILEYPVVLQDALREKKVTFSVARELSHIANESKLDYYLHYAIRDGVTPQLATQWRVAAQAEAPEENTDKDDFIAPQALVHSREPETNCFLCGKLAPYSEMMSVWIEKSCAHEFLKAMDSLDSENSPE